MLPPVLYAALLSISADFLTIPYESRGAALLYYTVSYKFTYDDLSLIAYLQGDDIVRLNLLFYKLRLNPVSCSSIAL